LFEWLVSKLALVSYLDKKQLVGVFV